MTMPVEYSLYQQWLGDALIDDFPLVVSNVTPTQLGPFPVSSFSAVELHIVNGGQPLQVQVYFTAQPTSITPAILNPIWTLVGTQTLDVIIPATAQFAWFSFIALGSSSDSIGVWAAPVNANLGEYSFVTPNPELVDFNQTFAIGFDTTIPLPAFIAGPAVFTCSTADTTGMLEFHVVTVTNGGAAQKALLFKVVPTTLNSSAVSLVLPAQPCGVRVINNDGTASHAGSYALVPKLSGL